MGQTVSVSIEVAASPEVVWGLVTDVGRMGEWSPECVEATWVDGATGPERGARFKGTNANGFRRWRTISRVTDVEPGRLFAFHVSVIGLKVSSWRYDFEPSALGCVVTESWIDERTRFSAFLGRVGTGVKDRASHNKMGMEETLAALKRTAEGSVVA